METKKCSECGEVKDLTEFKKVGFNATHMRKCISCYTETRRHNKSNGIKYNAREAHLRDSYGLSEGQYDLMLEEQGYACAICKSSETKAAARADRFVVDHDHITGRVRGLLCHACNRALGNFQDDPEILRNAIHYLSQTTPSETKSIDDKLNYETSGK